jgi:hypothetical protein
MVQLSGRGAVFPSLLSYALTVSGMYRHLRCKPMCMENKPNNAKAPVTKADSKAGFGREKKAGGESGIRKHPKTYIQ